MREIVFDTETTGREAEKGDRIVEIGCVELFNLSPTGRTLHLYLNPQCEVPEEVVRIHGLTGMFLRDKPLFASVASQIIEFFGDAPLIAHNAEFDRRFVNCELMRAGLPILDAGRFIDTLPIARKKFPGAANSLDALAKRFQLDRYGFDLASRKGPGGHGALVDSKILAEVYLQLKGGREQALSFETSAVSDEAAERAVSYMRRPQRGERLPSRLTSEEAAAHAAFVQGLGAEALWLRFRH